MERCAPMTLRPPTSVPVLASVRNGGFELGITSIDLHPEAWGVRGRLVGPVDRIDDFFRLEALNASGARFGGGGGGEGGDENAHDFISYFDSTPVVGETIRLIGTVDDVRMEVAITVAEPSWAAQVSVLRVESSSSSRWPRLGARAWRSPQTHLILQQVWEQRSTSALPDEVVPLGASVGQVAGHELVFLDAERWGDVWWLTHHWGNPAAMYSPLGGDIELVHEGGTIVGVQIGGGTSAHGVAYTHAFASPLLPDRLTLQVPASDGGPPLFEADVRTR
jgi:hypothetical protein